MRFLIICPQRQEEALLLAPVLQTLSQHYSKLSITLLVKKEYEYFFYKIPGVYVCTTDTKNNLNHTRIRRLFHLFRQLYKLGPYNKGIDLCNDFASYFLRFYFFFYGLYFLKLKSISGNQKRLTRRKWKRIRIIPSPVERYFALFEKLDLHIDKEKVHTKGPWINLDTDSRVTAHKFLTKFNLQKSKKDSPQYWIGLALFDEQSQKNYPTRKIIDLIILLKSKINCEIFMLGSYLHSPKKKTSTLIAAQEIYRQSSVIWIDESLDPKTISALIMYMDLVIASDTFYMHLASLLEISTTSLWGPTHPYAGYAPYGENEKNIVQIPHTALSCRPCSLYGEKPCFRGDTACIQWITISEIMKKVNRILNIE